MSTCRLRSPARAPVSESVLSLGDGRTDALQCRLQQPLWRGQLLPPVVEDFGHGGVGHGGRFCRAYAVQL